MATVTGAKVCLCNNKNSKSRVPLQGTDFVKDTTDVVIRYPFSGPTTLEWKGKIKKVGKNKKSGEAEVKQERDVAEKDKRDRTAEISITVGTTTIKVEADIYEE